MRRAALLLVLVLATDACSHGEPARPPLPVPPEPTLTPVVHDAVARLEMALPEVEEVEPADPERVRGLAQMAVGSSGQLRGLTVEEAKELGDAAVPELARLAADEEAGDDERAAALELLADVDTPRAADALAAILKEGKPAWVRAHAAWRLGATSQEWIVPQILLRLKYEVDHETVIWITRTLAHFGNYAGLVGLENVGRTSPDEALRNEAWGTLASLAEEAGFEDGLALDRAWRAGDERLENEEALPLRLQNELWQLAARFEEYQLRGVDDARYVLERCDARAVRLLTVALKDQNVYVRVHLAQSLQRMGPRARDAGPTLVASLGDPLLAPTAAEALGEIHYAPAGAELVALARDARVDPGLRLAAARAVGALGDAAPPEARDALRALSTAQGEPELGQAAAEALLGIGDTESALPLLAAVLADETLDSATTERALEAWLARAAADGDERLKAAFEEWHSLDPRGYGVVPPEERRATRQARHDLVTRLVAP